MARRSAQAAEERKSLEAENEAEARNNLQAHFENRGQLIGLGDEVSDLRRFFDVDDDEYWTVEEIPCK